MIVSQDRWFLDRIATHILAFEGNSTVVWHEGNYASYEEAMKGASGDNCRSAHQSEIQAFTKKVTGVKYSVGIC